LDTLQEVTIDTVDGPVKCVGCSYNGVAFFVEESESSGGRNIATTSLPFTNLHVNEDLGGRVKQFSLRIYIVGDDAEAKRSELEAAFDAEGAFELVHMYYGKFQARCTSYSFSHNSSELAYITGDVSFVPEKDPKAIERSSVDARGMAAAKADGSLSRAAGLFKAAFSIAGKAASVVQSTVDATNDVLDAIESARNSMRSVEMFVMNLSQIRDNIGLIMKTPGDFANRLQNLLTMTRETFDDNEDWNTYTNESLTMMSRVEVEGDETTTSALRSMVQRLALMSSASMAVKCVLESSYENSLQVYETEEALNAAFEAAMARVNSVDDYTDLADMLAIALKFLRDVKSGLAVVVEKPLNDISNVLTVAFDTYGNLDRVEDIIDRNEISDPSAIDRRFVKVLSK
jgi:prophage DNA circulation protein